MHLERYKQGFRHMLTMNFTNHHSNKSSHFLNIMVSFWFLQHFGFFLLLLMVIQTSEGDREPLDCY